MNAVRLLSLLLVFACANTHSDDITMIDQGVVAYLQGDYELAFTTFQSLASKNDSTAQFYIGVMYDHGLGVSQDFAQAAKWYFRAADQGDLRAQFNLGMMYDLGHGVAEDDSQAASWYRQAAEQGDAQAQNNLGVMYFSGEGVPEDKALAHAWISLANAQGDAEAQYNLEYIGAQLTDKEKERARSLAFELYGQYLLPYTD